MAAQPDDPARCVAQFVSSVSGPGFGRFVAEFAQENQPFGVLVGEEASTNVCLAELGRSATNQLLCQCAIGTK